MYQAHVSGMYTGYLIREHTFRVSAPTAHHRGLGSLLDTVPEPSWVGYVYVPHAESKRVFNAGQDRIFSEQSIVLPRVDRSSPLPGVSIQSPEILGLLQSSPFLRPFLR